MTVDAAHVPGRTAAGLLSASTVSANATDDLLQFSVTDPSPTVARTLATTYARQFTVYRRQLDMSALKAGLTDVRQRLDSLEALGQGSTPLARQLTGTMHQLETLQALQAAGPSAILVGPAGNASLVQPRTTRNAALGLVLGLALGTALAFLRNSLDPRVRSDDELRQRLNLPVLGRIPRQPMASADDRLAALTEPAGASAEAFRILKTNLSIMQRQHGVSSILITSTGCGRGQVVNSRESRRHPRSVATAGRPGRSRSPPPGHRRVLRPERRSGPHERRCRRGPPGGRVEGGRRPARARGRRRTARGVDRWFDPSRSG